MKKFKSLFAILAVLFITGVASLAAQDYDGAIVAFIEAGEYSDAAERILKIHYDLAEAALTVGEWEDALARIKSLEEIINNK